MENLFDLSGKVAVVTGSTKGIGLAIAEQMAFNGADVVISSRKEDACISVADEINAGLNGKGGKAIPIPVPYWLQGTDAAAGRQRPDAAG